MTDLNPGSQDTSRCAAAPRRRHVDVSGLSVGPDTFALIAGTCSVVSGPPVMRDAVALKRSGAAMLRGGWRKPHTRPGSYQGAGMAGLEILADARALTGLPIVTEVTDVRDVEHVVGRVDMIQIGARNMQHQPLLIEVGRTRTPVLLSAASARRSRRCSARSSTS